MRKSLLRRPSPALILASIALFVALGGGAYAATSDNAKDKKIARNVFFNNIGSASVSHASTADNATHANSATTANSATIANAANALNGVQIVAGPAITLATGLQGNQTVSCPSGMSAISGSEVNSSTNDLVNLNEVAEFSPGSVIVYLNNASGSTVTWHAYAVCINGTVSGSSAARSLK
jgi:hypothetical protein